MSRQTSVSGVREELGQRRMYKFHLFSFVTGRESSDWFPISYYVGIEFFNPPTVWLYWTFRTLVSRTRQRVGLVIRYSVTLWRKRGLYWTLTNGVNMRKLKGNLYGARSKTSRQLTSPWLRYYKSSGSGQRLIKKGLESIVCTHNMEPLLFRHRFFCFSASGRNTRRIIK